MPPFCAGEFVIVPFTYITLEPPPSKFIAYVQPKPFIMYASCVRVTPTEVSSRPSIVTITSSFFSLKPIALRGFLPVIEENFCAFTSTKISPFFTR